MAEDPVYATWRYLKQHVNGVIETEVDSIQLVGTKEHPLVTAGLIPRRLVEVFRTTPEKTKQVRRGTTSKARVLTSEELSREIRESDAKGRRYMLNGWKEKGPDSRKRSRKR